jgi:DNA-directed RNA polymerase specialized sigma24 family protein
MIDSKKIKLEIIEAGERAVKELVKVAKEGIIKKDLQDLSPELAADRLKNAAATKKLAIFDAFEILNRIEQERSELEDSGSSSSKNMNSFAERRAK